MKLCPLFATSHYTSNWTRFRASACSLRISDRDDPINFDRYLVRQPGRYLSRCRIPGHLLNKGVLVVGISASVPHVQQFFSDATVLRFSVDDAGSPGSQWAGDRGGFFRPALTWDIVPNDLQQAEVKAGGTSSIGR